MTNPTTHDNTKPSTVETIKEKAANLVHKVTGKTSTDHHHDAAHDHAHNDHIHPATLPDHTHPATLPDHSQDKVNTSAFLSSTRLPDETDPSVNATHPVTQPESSHIPAHVHNVAPGTGLGGALHSEHQDPLHKDHQYHHDHAHDHHKVDDPQHEITSRLVGAPKDPNNLESAHIKPVM
ncbi:hypothetical protein CPC16_007079 [Podila verticillata]|nr:hypothetical protein BGZ52_008515 [Haplosporangium bisporale]KAF9387369.1 hypothetical protein CPC16_007079 [Podila verticillata]